MPIQASHGQATTIPDTLVGIIEVSQQRSRDHLVLE
jgi:hypothetical protein